MNNNYKFLKRKGFESLEKYEKRLNEMASQGWRAINFTVDHGGMVVLLERTR